MVLTTTTVQQWTVVYLFQRVQLYVLRRGLSCICFNDYNSAFYVTYYRVPVSTTKLGVLCCGLSFNVLTTLCAYFVVDYRVVV